MADISELLKLMVERNGSDLFLKAGAPPRLRVDGKIVSLELPPLEKAQVEKIAQDMMNAAQLELFKKYLEVDFALDVPPLGRFRASALTQRAGVGLVLRHIRKDIADFEALNLPAEVLKKLCMESRGLIILCGATGSGKSTTLASMIEHINVSYAKHILTIEDPVEFTFEDKRSVVTQREIGFDTLSYDEALKHSMYHSPDVLLIGNIRDASTAQSALQAAETGQLVLSTLHAIDSSEAIERMVNFFPSHQHGEIRLLLSLLLKGVISLRLVPRKGAPGRIPAYEVMLASPTIKELIRDGKTHELQRYIEDGESAGMTSFDQHLVKLTKAGIISKETAREFADSHSALELGLSGMKRIREER